MCYTGNSAGFGVFRGNACFCILADDVDYYLDRREPGVCESPCVGETSLMMCGGENAYDVFQLVYDVPGSAVAEGVKADLGKNQEAFVVDSYGNYSTRQGHRVRSPSSKMQK